MASCLPYTVCLFIIRGCEIAIVAAHLIGQLAIQIGTSVCVCLCGSGWGGGGGRVREGGS